MFVDVVGEDGGEGECDREGELRFGTPDGPPTAGERSDEYSSSSSTAHSDSNGSKALARYEFVEWLL